MGVNQEEVSERCPEVGKEKWLRGALAAPLKHASQLLRHPSASAHSHGARCAGGVKVSGRWTGLVRQ